jgi:hypothetical protein
VDERCAVHGNCGDESAADEVSKYGSESNFDYVAADSPQNAAAAGAGGEEPAPEIEEILSREDIGQAAEEGREGGGSAVRSGKIRNVDFAGAGGQGVGFQAIELERSDGIKAHGLLGTGVAGAR